MDELGQKLLDFNKFPSELDNLIIEYYGSATGTFKNKLWQFNQGDLVQDADTLYSLRWYGSTDESTICFFDKSPLCYINYFSQYCSVWKILADSEFLYTICENQILRKLDKKSGVKIYDFDTKEEHVDDACIDEKYLYFLRKDQKLVSVRDKSNGLFSYKINLQNLDDLKKRGGFAIDDKFMYIYNNGFIHVLDKRDGKEIKKFDLKIIQPFDFSCLTVDDENIFIVNKAQQKVQILKKNNGFLFNEFAMKEMFDTDHIILVDRMNIYINIQTIIYIYEK